MGGSIYPLARLLSRQASTQRWANVLLNGAATSAPRLKALIDRIGPQFVLEGALSIHTSRLDHVVTLQSIDGGAKKGRKGGIIRSTGEHHPLPRVGCVWPHAIQLSSHLVQPAPFFSAAATSLADPLLWLVIADTPVSLTPFPLSRSRPWHWGLGLDRVGSGRPALCSVSTHGPRACPAYASQRKEGGKASRAPAGSSIIDDPTYCPYLIFPSFLLLTPLPPKPAWHPITEGSATTAAQRGAAAEARGSSIDRPRRDRPGTEEGGE